MLVSREEWLKRFEKIHGKGTFDYSRLPEEIYQSKMYEVYCNKHFRLFKISPSRHYNEKHGCPQCRYEKASRTRKNKLVLRKNFIAKAKQVHGDKYIYSEIPLEFSLNDVLVIFCSKHNHIFFCKGIDHLNGQGCGKE